MTTEELYELQKDGNLGYACVYNRTYAVAANIWQGIRPKPK